MQLTYFPKGELKSILTSLSLSLLLSLSLVQGNECENVL